jgi:hypothetical protein
MTEASDSDHLIRRDLSGHRYGRLVVVRLSHKNKYKKNVWVTKCDCGNEKLVEQTVLLHTKKTVRSCGCLAEENYVKSVVRVRRRIRAAVIARIESGVKSCNSRTCVQDNPQPFSAFAKDSNELDGHGRKCKECIRNYHLIRRLGPQAAAIKLQMLEAQGNRCANSGCRKTLLTTRDAHVDHDHETGAIRGILCGRCNSALGLVHDSPEKIRGLLEYAIKHRQLRLIAGGKK